MSLGIAFGECETGGFEESRHGARDTRRRVGIYFVTLSFTDRKFPTQDRLADISPSVERARSILLNTDFPVDEGIRHIEESRGSSGTVSANGFIPWGGSATIGGRTYLARYTGQNTNSPACNLGVDEGDFYMPLFPTSAMMLVEQFSSYVHVNMVKTLLVFSSGFGAGSKYNFAVQAPYSNRVCIFDVVGEDGTVPDDPIIQGIGCATSGYTAASETPGRIVLDGGLRFMPPELNFGSLSFDRVVPRPFLDGAKSYQWVRFLYNEGYGFGHPNIDWPVISIPPCCNLS